MRTPTCVPVTAGRTALRIFPTFLDHGLGRFDPQAAGALPESENRVLVFEFAARITKRHEWIIQRGSGGNMKLRRMVGSVAGLLLIAGLAHSQGTPQAPQAAPQDSGQVQVSNPSAGMEAYGGTSDTMVQSGSKHARPCRVNPQCNIFFGGS
ncbi:hypothetical protein ACTJLB_24105 [Paraburkholderia sp. 22098]|uniref:hypothetical protein n=1 Tax=Paraburkholderia sp. 22098 TaxID=3453874 RepID=UPI003F85F570